MEAGVVASLDVHPVGCGDLLPVTFPQPRVAQGVQDGHVRPELFNLCPDRFGDPTRRRRRRERLGQVASGAVHFLNLAL